MADQPRSVFRGPNSAVKSLLRQSNISRYIAM